MKFINKQSFVLFGFNTHLRGLDALLDRVRQVRTARADVAAEHVRSVALVVHAHGERHVLVGDGVDAAPHVDSEAADLW